MNVVITGASKGIGFAIAEKLLGSGQVEKLAICSRSRSEIDGARSRLLEKYPDAIIIAEECDVAREDEVAFFSDYVLRELGHVDVLVNNAGFGKFGPVHELGVDDWKDVLNTNVRGVFLLTKALLPSMRARRTGSIITISSIAGKNGFSGGAAYCASKFAVRGMMQSLFLEVRGDNVRVITLFPGSVDTYFFERAGAAPQMAQKALQSEDIADAVLTSIILPQHADISELDIRPTNPKG
jgi:NADP-dependent 3-hydroxy acid dehydrogenase YdfG